MLADNDVRAQAKFVLIGDRRLFEQGGELAGVTVDLGDDTFVDLGNLDPSAVPLGEASEITGAAALENFVTALRLCRMGGP